jgi:fatty acid desaturase
MLSGHCQMRTMLCMLTGIQYIYLLHIFSFYSIWIYRWKLQILTTQDYSTDSWFVTFMTGALNHQTAHHVFPGIAQCYLPIVTPIVKKTCEDFGVQYNYCGTLWDALSSHVGHLKRLGSIDKSGLSNQEVSVMKEKTY